MEDFKPVVIEEEFEYRYKSLLVALFVLLGLSVLRPGNKNIDISVEYSSRKITFDAGDGGKNQTCGHGETRVWKMRWR